MKRRRAAAALITMLLLRTTPATAHPVPFSYLDVRLQPHEVEIAIVAHIFDVSHDLNVDPPERLLEAGFLAGKSDALIALLAARLQIAADGTTLTPVSWSSAEALADRQSVRVRARYEVQVSPGIFTVDARMFPYDTSHQTFVNVYEGETLTLQAILDVARTRLEYFPGSRQGAFAVGRRFMPSGLRHIFLGSDHLLFLLGLLLLGGSLRRLTFIAGAFAAGNSVAFALTVFNVLHPPARIIEPAVALSIVYVGADNLMVRGGRDMRVWIALAFGFIHGFWFANGLREMDLPSRALTWSLLSFDVGVEVAQAAIVFAAGSAISVLHARRKSAGSRLAYAGSLVAIVGGVYWFVQRVFFPGGIV
jgi:hydrogenase/urease accessory protein HupE